MPSASHAKFKSTEMGSRILKSFVSSPSPACPDQALIDQECMKAAIANIVGCWEGYVENVLREFVAKTRVHAHRRAWSLISQFEVMVDKAAKDLNTPNWDKTRELLMQITGIDPFSSWVWAPKFSSPQDTKEYLDGILNVRHAFAHGFAIPADIKGLGTPGILDPAYVDDAFRCIDFFVDKTDLLLEHDLIHRHDCRTGWS